MSANDVLLLWEGEAPYTAECGKQTQPCLTAWPVEGSRGAVVICPGGGYAGKDGREGDPVAWMLNSEGISAFVLNYRTSPCPHEAPLSDAQRAIRLVRSLGYEKVGILGFSAGGNVCCNAAVLFDAGNPDSDDPLERLSSRPDAFAACYPVVTMGEYTHEGSRNNLLHQLAGDEALRRRYSAEENVTPNTPPGFIWHTATDQLVPVENSLQLAAALSRNKVPFEMHIYPYGSHGMNLAAHSALISGWSALCCRFLNSYGFGR